MKTFEEILPMDAKIRKPISLQIMFWCFHKTSCFLSSSCNFKFKLEITEPHFAIITNSFDLSTSRCFVFDTIDFVGGEFPIWYDLAL